MSNENNKMQVDIENLFKQNVNDLSAIKELYRKLKEVEEKILQIKYIDSTLAKKLKKEYEKLKKIILDENVQAKLFDDIETLNTKLTNDINTINANLTDAIETINTKLTDDIETINSRIDTNTHKIAYISMFDEVNKWLLLKQLMDKYDEIIIDEDITINCNDIYLLNKDIKISGNCKITVISDNLNIIKINKPNLSININGVKLDLQNNGYFISGNGENGYLGIDVDNVVIENCNITGKGVLLCLYISPKDIKVVKVKNTYINNNTISNLKMQYIHTPDNTENFQLYGLFVIENASIENIICNNNVITNTERSIFQLKNRNEYNIRNNITITNNILINDAGCWGDHTVYYIYYVFAIAEAKNVTYKNNHVEGLKIKTKTPGGYGAVLYDFYGSGDNVIYENNVCKNNVAFYEFDDDLTPNNNSLIKCKGAINMSYKNNSFIIEENFIEYFSESETIKKNDFRILDYDATTYIENRNWLVENNTIDVPYLSFESEGNDSKILVFKNNVIKCKTIFGPIFSLNSNDGLIRECINNSIIASEKHKKNPLNLFRSFSVNTNPIKENSLMTFRDNIILVPNFNIYDDHTQLTDSEFRYQRCLRFERLIITNNTFSNAINNLNSIFSATILQNNNYIKNIVTSNYAYGITLDSTKETLIKDSIEYSQPTKASFSISPTVNITKSGYITATVYKDDGSKDTQLFKIQLSPQSSSIDDETNTTNGCDIEVTKGGLTCSLYHGDWDKLNVSSVSSNVVKIDLDIHLY